MNSFAEAEAVEVEAKAVALAVVRYQISLTETSLAQDHLGLASSISSRLSLPDQTNTINREYSFTL